jgi:hypothetical protein
MDYTVIKCHNKISELKNLDIFSIFQTLPRFCYNAVTNLIPQIFDTSNELNLLEMVFRRSCCSFFPMGVIGFMLLRASWRPRINGIIIDIVVYFSPDNSVVNASMGLSIDVHFLSTAQSSDDNRGGVPERLDIAADKGTLMSCSLSIISKQEFHLVETSCFTLSGERFI